MNLHKSGYIRVLLNNSEAYFEMIFLTKEQIQEIIKHSQQEYPKEACGILAGKISPQSTVHGQQSELNELRTTNYELRLVTKVYKMANISEKPEICYFMDPKEQLKVMKEIRNLGLEMVGIYHSHAHTEAYPSKRDCELAFYKDVDYVIVSLKKFSLPEVHAFKIEDSKIIEKKVVIRKNILFVCIENSCRSQIAEGLTNSFYWDKFNAYSAGSRPSGIVNPVAIEVMKEINVDISKQKSKGFLELKDIEFDYLVTMGCGDVCPVFPAKHEITWNIEDPKGKPIEIFRRVRDEIREKIEQLAKQA